VAYASRLQTCPSDDMIACAAPPCTDAAGGPTTGGPAIAPPGTVDVGLKIKIPTDCGNTPNAEASGTSVVEAKQAMFVVMGFMIIYVLAN